MKEILKKASHFLLITFIMEHEFYNVPPRHKTAVWTRQHIRANSTADSLVIEGEKHIWQRVFVLHPLWQQLMETVLLWTLCHWQMDPLGLCLYKSYPFQTHLFVTKLEYVSFPICTQAHSPLISESLRSLVKEKVPQYTLWRHVGDGSCTASDT